MRKVPPHPRDRLRRRTKHKNDDNIMFVWKVSCHSRDRLKGLKRKDDNVVSMKKVPSHPRERLRRTKQKNDNDNVMFEKKFPPHLEMARLIR